MWETDAHAAEIDQVLARLGASDFRRRFRLREAELVYIEERGLETIESHARDFVRTRLAPAAPRNDGRQTPMRGHPVFIAQHATACCCRGCLYNWHGIKPGLQLTQAQQAFIVRLLMTWIQRQTEAARPQL